MTVDRETQVRRAREVLADAGWLFDDFVNAEMRKILVSEPADVAGREEAYRRARVATEMKVGLEAILNEATDDQTMQTHRDKLKGAP